MNLIEFFENFFGNYEFIFTATCISFSLKVFILFTLTKKIIYSTTTKLPWFFLLTILISNMSSDLAWIIKLTQLLFLPAIGYKIVLFVIRFAWVFFIVQYQSLALFIEALVKQQSIISTRQKLSIVVSVLFCLFFTFISIFDFHCIDPSHRLAIEPIIQNIATFYVLFPLILPSLFIAIKKIRLDVLPLLLKKQLKIFVQGLIVPLWIADFLQLCPFKIYSLNVFAHSYAAVGFTTLILTLAIYFCARKILGLRFLNLKNHVQQPININFIDDFKTILERLSLVSNFRELGHITQNFFKDTFNIPSNKTRLYLRKIDSTENNEQANLAEDNTASLVETFLATHTDVIDTAIKEQKILIYDEIDFSHFYDACKEGATILKFLKAINADIFLPIYENDKLLAYIIVDRYARIGQFYSNVERDELIVYASYLGNIINLLKNKNLDALIEQEQNLRKELYHKHQEINQYKESIRSFLHKNKSKQIGIVFYKNRYFTYGNQAAKELVEININKQQGHPLTQAFKRLAQQVEAYKGPQTTFAQDTKGNSLVLSAVPHLEQNTVIITVSYPDISDIIKHHIDLLKDPTEWDYLLYLQTTQSGKLINQLIPGTGQTLLNFKIELLKIALSRKAILLNIPEHDIMPMVEVLHHISLRDTLHVLNLQGQSQNLDIAITLFGINPIFGINMRNQQPLLEKLNNIGTLFIKNIHFLDLETQEYLAEFIRYGFYRIYKSDQKIASNVRVIVSSNQNLQQLVHEGKFSKALFKELKATTLSMPSLLTLPEDELNTLAEGFTQQAVTSDAFQHMLALTDKEKNMFAVKRPASLQELKTKVQQLLIKKSKKNHIYQETEFDPAYEVTDPDLIQAARLGKQALKDQKIMTLLWNKFKNQNKIALFLGVNRSSVNRRCKDFNLI